jgi:hypothetical protein
MTQLIKALWLAMILLNNTAMGTTSGLRSVVDIKYPAHKIFFDLLVSRFQDSRTPINAPPIILLPHSTNGYDTVFFNGLIKCSAAIIKDASSDDEVAFILAHELGHATLRHDEWMRDNPDEPGEFLEADADNFALELLAQSGYDPFAAVDAVISLKKGRHGKRIPRLEARLLERGYERRERQISPEFVAAKLERPASRVELLGQHAKSFASTVKTQPTPEWVTPEIAAHLAESSDELFREMIEQQLWWDRFESERKASIRWEEERRRWKSMPDKAYESLGFRNFLMLDKFVPRSLCHPRAEPALLSE